MEFAIVCMVFLLFIFGIIDFGYYFYHQHVLKDAAREGARIAILGDISDDQVKQKVMDKLSILKTTEKTITISPYNWSDPDQAVTVTVSIPFTFLILPNFAGVNINSVSSSITMVHEP